MESELVAEAPNGPWFVVYSETVGVPPDVDFILQKAMDGKTLRRIDNKLPVFLKHTIGDAGQGQCLVTVYGCEYALIDGQTPR